MKKKKIIKQTIVIGIIILFFGASVVLGISDKTQTGGLKIKGEVMDAPILSEPTPKIAYPDDDWDFYSNPPHMSSIPSGNVGIGGVPAEDSKLYIKTNFSEFKYGIYAESQKGIRSINTAFDGTGITGEGGHAGMIGYGGFIGLVGYGYYGGWFEGMGYFRDNVGIGTTTPNEKLEVNGTIHSTSGGIKFPDGTTQTTASTNVNPMQIALLRWYEANEAGIFFSVGGRPYGIAFDGANIWVTNSDDDTVSKLRASDGSMIGTYAVGDSPYGVAFDGAFIWVANYNDDTVSKLRASDGYLCGTYAVGYAPYGIAFDGTNIWISNTGSDTVSKLRATDGSMIGTYTVGNAPQGVAFDGTYIWVNKYAGTVSKLRASDGSMIGTYTVGNAPRDIAFDGACIWVANSNSDTVSKL